MVTEPTAAGPRHVAIIGAGMAGLACADHLTRAGLSVRLLDKGRGVGGRMSTRRIETTLGEARFDHGAPFFTGKDPDFRRCLQDWMLSGHVARWPMAGPDAFVGLPTMNAPLKALAERLDVDWNAHVVGLSRGSSGWILDVADRAPGSEGPFDAVVLAVPPEQASPLLSPHSFDLAVHAAMARSDAVWSTMVVFDQQLPLEAGLLGHCDTLALAVREASKPGRPGIEAWTLQATSDWSGRHLAASSAEVVARLLEALARRLAVPLPQVLAAQAHRWRYARAARATSGPTWRQALGLGLCGDWVLGDDVEAAMAIRRSPC